MEVVRPHPEQHILGSALASGELEADGWTEADFTDARNRAVFAAMRKLTVDGKTITLAGVAEALRDLGTLETAGSVPYLIELSERVPTRRNLN